MINRVCVFCASSKKSPQAYLQDAAELGKILAENKIELVYGGGSVGLMGYMADAALEHNGEVIGIIPDFMVEMEWAHPGVQKMEIVSSMHERKRKMVENTDAVIALPGGSGTFEELLEVITSKRLGLYTKPIIIVNVNGFYDPLIELFQNCIRDQLMDIRHLEMWQIVRSSKDAIPAIKNFGEWSQDALQFAAI